MTNEELEKKAEEWVIENMDCCKTDNSVNQSILYFSEEERCIAKSAFKDGAEFGYNKANEWYKVSDKLPEMDVLVYLWNKSDDFPVVACRHILYGQKDWVWNCIWGSGFTVSQLVGEDYLWKEIVFPKENE